MSLFVSASLLLLHPKTIKITEKDVRIQFNPIQLNIFEDFFLKSCFLFSILDFTESAHCWQTNTLLPGQHSAGLYIRPGVWCPGISSSRRLLKECQSISKVQDHNTQYRLSLKLLFFMTKFTLEVIPCQFSKQNHDLMMIISNGFMVQPAMQTMSWWIMNYSSTHCYGWVRRCALLTVADEIMKIIENEDWCWRSKLFWFWSHVSNKMRFKDSNDDNYLYSLKPTQIYYMHYYNISSSVSWWFICDGLI